MVISSIGFHVFLLFGISVCADEDASGVTDYCAYSTFSPRCDENQQISMTQAMFGTIRIGQCMGQHLNQFTGCVTDALDYFDKSCSGLQSCDVVIPPLELTQRLDCLKGISPYLEASYKCVRVLQDDKVCVSPKVIEATNSDHFLSTVNALQTQCGLQNTPYIIQAKPGQTINISMTDFSWKIQAVVDNVNQCASYGYILDSKNDDVITMCGNNARFKHIYTSTGDSVQILLESARLEHHKFLLQFKALGCPDIKPPEHAWIQQKEDSITIGCYSNSDTWDLQCIDNSWIGFFGKCELPTETTETALLDLPVGIESDDINGKEPKPLNITRNHILIVTIGCMTLISCSLLIILGIYCNRKNQKDANGKGSYHAYASYDPYRNGLTTYRSDTNGTFKSENMILPAYTMQVPRRDQQRLPDLPQQNIPQSQSDGTESVQYYVLESTGEHPAF